MDIKTAVGFDISDAAIEEAQELASISKRNADFVRMNILEMDPKYNHKFDFIYISEGSFQWFPSLMDYFAIVSRLLKKGGHILIFEIHPFAYYFEQTSGINREVQLDDFISYFEAGP